MLKTDLANRAAELITLALENANGATGQQAARIKIYAALLAATVYALLYIGKVLDEKLNDICKNLGRIQ